jgi:hypothetical protein
MKHSRMTTALFILMLAGYITYGQSDETETECMDKIYTNVCRHTCVSLIGEGNKMANKCFQTKLCFNSHGFNNCCDDIYNCFICLKMSCDD